MANQQMMLNMGKLEASFHRKVLIEALESHRDEHEQNYKDALDVYRDDVAAAMKKLLDRHHKERDILTDFTVTHNLGLTAPINCVDSYDKLIHMFEMMTDEEIKMEFSEANRILNNDWQWLEAAATANSFYSSRKM